MNSENASKDTSGSESGVESPCIAPADRQCHLLYPANRLFVAPTAQRFTPWGTVAYYFYRWKCSEKWQKILAALTAEERKRQGRPPEPSAVIIDSQSMKTTEKGRSKAMML